MARSGRLNGTETHGELAGYVVSHMIRLWNSTGVGALVTGFLYHTTQVTILVETDDGWSFAEGQRGTMRQAGWVRSDFIEVDIGEPA